MNTLNFLPFILAIVLLSCNKSDEQKMDLALRGHWKYIGYIDRTTGDTIRPSIYHTCDSCMSVIVAETTYYARSKVKKFATKGYTIDNKIILISPDAEEDIGEAGLDVVFWTVVRDPDAWEIADDQLKLTSAKIHQTLLFFKHQTEFLKLT